MGLMMMRRPLELNAYSTRCGVEDLRSNVPIEMRMPMKKAMSRLKIRH